MIDEFDDFYTDLLFEQLSANDDEIIEEANISSNDIGAPRKSKEKPRNIMITGS